MRFNLIICLTLFVSACLSSTLCGRYSDNCGTVPGQDIDYIFYVGKSGDVEAIEMDNNEPEDKECGENHLVALIWHYSAKRITPGINDFTTVLDRISFAAWNNDTLKSYSCNRTMEYAKQYRLYPNPEIECFIGGYNPWKGFEDFIGQESTMSFSVTDTRVIYGRFTLQYVNNDGCVSMINDTTWIVILVVVLFLAILCALGITYYFYQKKSVKTLAGEKIKLYKQNQPKHSIFSIFSRPKRSVSISKGSTLKTSKSSRKPSVSSSDTTKKSKVENKNEVKI